MKSDYFDKRRERNKQKLEVLLSHPDFQADIAELRKLLKIPEGGFTDENAYTMWEINLELETQKYFSENSPSMMQRLQELKEKGQMAEFEQEQLVFNQKAPKNFINYCVWKLIHKYKLSAQWRSSLKNYVIFNDVGSFWIPASNISMNIKWDKKTGHRELSLIIYANTTLEDVKAIWPQVMKQQEQLQDKDGDKPQPIPNLKLDKRVHELWKSGGKTYEQIAEVIRDEFKLPDFIYTDVSNALKRYKKRFG